LHVTIRCNPHEHRLEMVVGVLWDARYWNCTITDTNTFRPLLPHSVLLQDTPSSAIALILVQALQHADMHCKLSTQSSKTEVATLTLVYPTESGLGDGATGILSLSNATFESNEATATNVNSMSHIKLSPMVLHMLEQSTTVPVPTPTKDDVVSQGTLLEEQYLRWKTSVQTKSTSEPPLKSQSQENSILHGGRSRLRMFRKAYRYVLKQSHKKTKIEYNSQSSIDLEESERLHLPHKREDPPAPLLR
jgi:hypothetical protein